MSRSVFARLMLVSALLIPAQSAAAQHVAGNIGSMPGSTEQRLADSLSAIGMTRCASRAVQVGRFLMEGSAANFTVQPLGPNGDMWPTVITMESSHASNGTTRLSMISISPNCAGFYQQTIYWTQPCAALRSGIFAPFTGTRRLLDNVTIGELDVATQLYLMPAGPQGCVSVKKELFR